MCLYPNCKASLTALPTSPFLDFHVLCQKRKTKHFYTTQGEIITIYMQGILQLKQLHILKKINIYMQIRAARHFTSLFLALCGWGRAKMRASKRKKSGRTKARNSERARKTFFFFSFFPFLTLVLPCCLSPTTESLLRAWNRLVIYKFKQLHVLTLMQQRALELHY